MNHESTETLEFKLEQLRELLLAEALARVGDETWTVRPFNGWVNILGVRATGYALFAAVPYESPPYTSHFRVAMADGDGLQVIDAIDRKSRREKQPPTNRLTLVEQAFAPIHDRLSVSDIDDIVLRLV